MSDSLKQAVEGLEVAWRRLREVLDGPDVAAALVERQAVRPMSTALRDGQVINLHMRDGETVMVQFRSGRWEDWVEKAHDAGNAIGWSPVK